MGEDTGGREVWWWVCGQYLLVASALSETRSLAESEGGGGGFLGLRRVKERNFHLAELKSEGSWDV